MVSQPLFFPQHMLQQGREETLEGTGGGGAEHWVLNAFEAWGVGKHTHTHTHRVNVEKIREET